MQTDQSDLETELEQEQEVETPVAAQAIHNLEGKPIQIISFAYFSLVNFKPNKLFDCQLTVIADCKEVSQNAWMLQYITALYPCLSLLPVFNYNFYSTRNSNFHISTYLCGS